MAQLGAVCSADDYKSVIKDSCIHTPGLIERLILTNDTSLVLTEADIKNENGELDQLVLGKKIFVTSSFANATDNSTGIQTSDTGYGKTVKTSPSNLNVTFDVFDSYCNREIMAKYWDNKQVGVILVDGEGRGLGRNTVNEAGEKALGFVTGTIFIQRMHMKATTADIAYTYSLTLTMDVFNQDRLDGLATQPYLALIEGVADLDLTVIGGTYNDITGDGTVQLKLTKGCSGVDVTGLTSFVFKDPNGSDVTIDLNFDSETDNIYTFMYIIGDAGNFATGFQGYSLCVDPIDTPQGKVELDYTFTSDDSAKLDTP